MRGSHTIPITIALAVTTFSPALAHGSDRTVQIQPLEASLGQETIVMVEASIEEALSILEFEQETEAAWTLSVTIERAEEQFLLEAIATELDTGEIHDEQSTTDKQGLLASIVRLIQKVLPAIPDPCKGIDCSGHGICVVEQDTPTCECDDDFFADKKTALECHPRSAKPKLSGMFAGGTPMDDQSATQVNALASAGFGFGAVTLASTLAGFISLSVHLQPTGKQRPRTLDARTSFFIFNAVALASHTIGIPLLLGSRMKARKAMGLAPHTSQTIAGWSIYAVTTATMATSFVTQLGFVFPAITLPLMIAGVWVSMHEARKAADDAKLAEQIGKGPVIYPVLSASENGGIVGVGGVF